MELLINLIGITVILLSTVIVLLIQSAWTFGGEFYITENGGRRKMWIERLLDGFEVLRRM